jgi:hypothetical protein
LKAIACALFACLLALSFFASRTHAAPQVPIPPPGVGGNSPIVFDMKNNGVLLTNIAEGTSFDLNANGFAEPCGWTQQYTDDAFLALDNDNDGEIRDATELFGNHTSGAADGYMALARYDTSWYGGNGDGIIDSRDTVYTRLKLWYDLDHDGDVDLGVPMSPAQAAAVGYPGFGAMNELQPMSFKVKSINLAYSQYMAEDQYGNMFRFGSSAVLKNVPWPANQIATWDVYLVVAAG